MYVRHLGLAKHIPQPLFVVRQEMSCLELLSNLPTDRRDCLLCCNNIVKKNVIILSAVNFVDNFKECVAIDISLFLTMGL